DVLKDKNNVIIGFLDESSPQTTANSQRLWSFTKPVIKKNTTDVIGFYAINRHSVIDFKEHSKKEDVCDFLKLVRIQNPNKHIIIILDNFRSHWANKTREKASELNITLVFLPPYSPDLNPIEFIWKSIKRAISPLFIKTKEIFLSIIQNIFYTLAKSLSFADEWINNYLKNKFNLLC
ncbi:MAG TPA: IS630 family transposase, partial [Thermoplasmatales archaeon]|nr:IS630 family transposase [Thermoplasmatales archaeon]